MIKAWLYASSYLKICGFYYKITIQKTVLNIAIILNLSIRLKDLKYAHNDEHNKQLGMKVTHLKMVRNSITNIFLLSS